MDNLIGIDPVGKFYTGSRPRTGNTENVVRVDAESDDTNRSDHIERLGKVSGGGVPNAFNNPDTLIVVDANHEEFGKLYEAKGPNGQSAKDIVDKSYEEVKEKEENEDEEERENEQQ